MLNNLAISLIRQNQKILKTEGVNEFWYR